MLDSRNPAQGMASSHPATMTGQTGLVSWRFWRVFLNQPSNRKRARCCKPFSSDGISATRVHSTSLNIVLVMTRTSTKNEDLLKYSFASLILSGSISVTYCSSGFADWPSTSVS